MIFDQIYRTVTEYERSFKRRVETAKIIFPQDNIEVKDTPYIMVYVRGTGFIEYLNTFLKPDILDSMNINDKELFTQLRNSSNIMNYFFPAPDKVTEIKMRQYVNLREAIDLKLKKPLLGEGYYNYGCDAYSCDIFMVDDIKAVIDERTLKLRIYIPLLITSVVLNIILVLYIILAR